MPDFLQACVGIKPHALTNAGPRLTAGQKPGCLPLQLGPPAPGLHTFAANSIRTRKQQRPAQGCMSDGWLSMRAQSGFPVHPIHKGTEQAGALCIKAQCRHTCQLAAHQGTAHAHACPADGCPSGHRAGTLRCAPPACHTDVQRHTHTEGTCTEHTKGTRTEGTHIQRAHTRAKGWVRGVEP